MNKDVLGLDPQIVPLVRTMNESGLFTTIASCEGHRWRGMGPYVYFRASVWAAAVLNRLIDDALRGEAGGLHYPWLIDARFNLNYELCFGLRLPDRYRWPWACCSRRKVDEDFSALEKLVQRAATDHWKDHPPEVEECAKREHQGQNDAKPNEIAPFSLASAEVAGRIRGTALWTRVRGLADPCAAFSTCNERHDVSSEGHPIASISLHPESAVTHKNGGCHDTSR